MNSKGRFAKRILIFMFSFITIYTLLVLLGTYLTGIPEPSSLTVGIFGLFGVETVNLMIKKLKEKEVDDDEPNGINNYDGIDDSECSSATDEFAGGDSKGTPDIERNTDQYRGTSNCSAIREPWYIRIFRP